jgi:hypothetical protein
MTRFRTAALVLLFAISAGFYSARAEKPAEDIAAAVAENAALKTKFEALIAVQGQCLEAVQQFRNGRRAGQD